MGPAFSSMVHCTLWGTPSHAIPASRKCSIMTRQTRAIPPDVSKSKRDKSAARVCLATQLRQEHHLHPPTNKLK